MTSTAFNYSGTELDALAGAVNYYSLLARCFAPYASGRVVEVGAGVGTFAEYLLRAPAVAELVLVEPADNNFPVLRERFAGVPRVRTVHGYLDQLEAATAADALVAVNVMEHVEDDRAFLEHAGRVLRPGGHLFLFVPAVPQIYGSLDAAFEHFRRYTRRGLDARLRGAGFEVLDLRYTNLPGVLGWALMGKVLRRRTLSPGSVETYDRWVLPVVARMEELWRPPIGQSLLAVTRRPAAPAHTIRPDS